VRRRRYTAIFSFLFVSCTRASLLTNAYSRLRESSSDRLCQRHGSLFYCIRRPSDLFAVRPRAVVTHMSTYCSSSVRLTPCEPPDRGIYRDPFLASLIVISTTFAVRFSRAPTRVLVVFVRPTPCEQAGREVLKSRRFVSRSTPRQRTHKCHNRNFAHVG